MTYSEVLNRVYEEAQERVASNNLSTDLPEDVKNCVEFIAARAEDNKGIATVIMTLLTYKVVHPMQDIRNHQAQLPDGFAGRTIDKAYVTPFMKSKSFPSMAESGWLTRSLEQPHPYNLSYPGRITPALMKSAFLNLIDQVQCRGADAEGTLLY